MAKRSEGEAIARRCRIARRLRFRERQNIGTRVKYLFSDDKDLHPYGVIKEITDHDPDTDVALVLFDDGAEQSLASWALKPLECLKEKVL